MKESYIEIVGLKVDTIIGVPEEERDSPQSVSIDLKFKPTKGLKNLGDNIEHTVDYYLVAQIIKKICASGQRKLIETLAEDIIGQLKKDFDIEEIDLRIKKFILPETEFISVVMSD